VPIILWLASTLPRVQYYSLLLLVTSASDLPMRSLHFCSVLFCAAVTDINEVDACCYQHTRRLKFVDSRHGVSKKPEPND